MALWNNMVQMSPEKYDTKPNNKSDVDYKLAYA